MAPATQNLGFGVTITLSFEPPYTFARRISTLDHLTNGRIGWNIVTGYLDSAARAMGQDKQTAHDDRYDVAEEYMGSSTSCGKAAGRTMPSVRDRARGFSPVRQGAPDRS